jgi:putative PIN family toxin of toxin-antitoxin system
MRLVLDTNVLLVSISRKSRYHWLFEHLLSGNFTLCVTSDILLEYEEIIGQHMGTKAANSVLGLIENLENVHFANTTYRFNLLQDADDNKFVDCAIATNADYIVTHDSDFNILKKIDFPKVLILNLNEIQKRLEGTSQE